MHCQLLLSSLTVACVHMLEWGSHQKHPFCLQRMHITASGNVNCQEQHTHTASYYDPAGAGRTGCRL